MRRAATTLLGTVTLAGAVALSGCAFTQDSPRLNVEMREWYPGQDIVIPFEIEGSQPYAEFRYEYNAGDEWELGIDRTVRIPRDNRGLIELSAADPASYHRVSFTTLVQPGPGQPLEPYSVVERYFRIDTTAPSTDSGSLLITAYSDGTEVAGPTYDPWMNLEIVIAHVEFDTPSGSPVRIYFTRDGSFPSQWSEEMDGPRSVWVWDGDGSSHTETFRFIAVDKAGNRSGVRTVVFQSF